MPERANGNVRKSEHGPPQILPTIGLQCALELMPRTLIVLDGLVITHGEYFEQLFAHKPVALIQISEAVRHPMPTTAMASSKPLPTAKCRFE